MHSVSFRAPWSLGLRLISTVVTALLVCLNLFFWSRMGVAEERLALGLVSIVPIAIIVGAALFTIRGYRLEPSQLLVRRLFWSTGVPLAGLRRAWADRDALKGSLRLVGNGGLFSISGLFRNKTLGSYRAFATDPARAVVLELPKRTVVVTPESPAKFLEQLERAHPTA